MVDAISINPYLNIVSGQMDAGQSLRSNDADIVKKEFMTIFLAEILKSNFQPTAGFHSILNEENNPFPNQTSLYDDMIVQKLAEELVDSQAFGFDNYVPREIMQRKELINKWQP